MEKTIGIWKPIRDFEGIYEVSPYGDVRRISTNRLLNFQTTYKGYLRVSLSNKENKAVRSVHRVVAEAYITNPRNVSDVNHIDGDRKNNHVENLEWVTSRENTIHGWKRGRKARQ